MINIYNSEFTADATNQRDIALFEADCMYAFSKGYTHILDNTTQLYRILEGEDEIELVKEDEEFEEVEEELLELATEAVIEQYKRTKQFDNETVNVLLKLVQVRTMILENM